MDVYFEGSFESSYSLDCLAKLFAMESDEGLDLQLDPEVVISGWMCTVCNRTPPPGEKVRICQECRVGFLGRYCSKACQERHWKFHKQQCQNMRQLGEPERQDECKKWLAKQISRASFLLHRRPCGALSNVTRLGWKHRALSPVIIYGDPNFPHGDFYALPRVFWDSEDFGSVKLRNTLRRAFTNPKFNSDKKFIVVDLHAKASVIIMALPINEDLLETHEQFCITRLGDEDTCTVLSKLRKGDIQEAMAAFREDPQRYRRIVRSYTMAGAMLDHAVQIGGLRNATHLNGRAGKFFLSRQIPEKGTQGRHVITLDDGKSVGVPFLNIEYVETLTFSDKLDDLARKILDDPALPVPERDPRVVARSPEYESDWMPDRCSAEARST